MKSSYKVLIGGILLFGGITLLTSSLHYNADGADTYGFPLNFYKKVSGYDITTGQGGTSRDLNVLALIGDIVFALSASWFILLLIKKFNRKTNSI